MQLASKDFVTNRLLLWVKLYSTRSWKPMCSFPIGGAAFIVSSPMLAAILVASLPAMLIWVASAGIHIRREMRDQA